MTTDQAKEATTLETTLETKLKQLLITCGRTNAVLDSSKDIAIERQMEALKALSTEVETSRRAVEAVKIINDEEEAEIDNWNAEIEAKLAKGDNEFKRLDIWLDHRKQAKEKLGREEKMKFELELHETKMKLETEHQAKTTANQPTVEEKARAKLPKLTISKFNGTYMDWSRFWSQFEESVEKSGLATVTKFSYLKELLDSKVRREVEALPFTPEGYNRAKAILTEKYGKESEIVKAYGKEILDLPYISSTNPRKIKEFSEKLTYCVQSLETLKKLDEVKGLVAMTLDKLPAIRGDLVRSDNQWESWDFCQLAEALRLWLRRHPVDSQQEHENEQNTKRRERRANMFNTRREEYNPRGYIYCDSDDHKAIKCTKITAVSDRKQILSKKRLCFNCAVGSHRAAQCQSKISCQNCGKRHHTSLCDKACDQEKKNVALAASGGGEGVFPVVLVKVDGIITRALVDTGAGSSYVSAKVVNMMHKKPIEVTTKHVEMIMGSHIAKTETYDAVLGSIDDTFQMDVKLTKVDKTQLLSVDNPRYEQMKETYPYLNRVNVADKDVKDQLPIHVILGVGDYTKIKTNKQPVIGEIGEPIAEYTKMGWLMMSPGQEFDRKRMLLTQTRQADYEELCRLDVLGLKDSADHDQQIVHAEFKEQLQRSPEGWYETGLPWRSNHSPLPSNEIGSLQRLNGLTKKLKRDGHTEEYDAVIRGQIEEGIVEKAPEVPTSKEFYIPHKCVIKESSETTKLRVVYDASARANPEAPSLNECLYTGPPLQNKLWDVLIQQRAYPVMVSGDIRQAFPPGTNKRKRKRCLTISLA